MKKVLIAEDEASIREFVVFNLERRGYEVIQASDGIEALKGYEANRDDIDVCLLDVMMPGVDGLEVCRRIRESSDTVGILMLTAKTQEEDRVNGLMSGADDYIVKPFSLTELMARVDSVYRRVSLNRRMERAARTPPDKIVIKPFELNIRSRTLSKDGEKIDLTQVEFQIIEFFFSNPGVVLSRDGILRRVWGDAYYGDEKVVDVNIRRLRMKLEDEPSNPRYLKTVWGQGYTWVTE
ncbi:MAG: response regulator transcription factor [Clostridia bacterium]|nr:response regulator transcription factor [Clostridia bacterium]